MSDFCPECQWIHHKPRPGPDYRSWRCMTCGEPVSYHEPWWYRWHRRIQYFLRSI